MKSFWQQRIVKELFLYSLTVLACTGITIWAQHAVIAPTTPQHELLSYKLLPAMLAGYFAAALFYALYALQRRKKWLGGIANLWAAVAAVLAGTHLLTGAWETYQVLEIGHSKMTNIFEVSILLLAFLAVMALVLPAQKHISRSDFGVFVAPLYVAGAVFVMWLEQIGQAGHRELIPALQSYWLPWHVLANFVGYGAFALAAAAGAMLLWRLRLQRLEVETTLPAPKIIEDVMVRAIAVGFPVFTLAIILGSIWAYEAWGGYWSWDPKETWALIVWLIYAGFLHARYRQNIAPQWFAWWAIAGFIATLFCYLGVNMFLSGLHSYGSIS